MGDAGGVASFRLLQDYKARADRRPVDLDDLQRRLSTLPGFDQVELQAHTPSTVVAKVPARNKRESDRLKALVNERLEGWRVIEEQSYSLPKTF